LHGRDEGQEADDQGDPRPDRGIEGEIVEAPVIVRRGEGGPGVEGQEEEKEEGEKSGYGCHYFGEYKRNCEENPEK
jgi:hypothetical protein